jgi:hypothetical protein
VALQTGFVPAPQTPPGLAELDPRSGGAEKGAGKTV